MLVIIICVTAFFQITEELMQPNVIKDDTDVLSMVESIPIVGTLIDIVTIHIVGAPWFISAIVNLSNGMLLFVAILLILELIFGVKDNIPILKYF